MDDDSTSYLNSLSESIAWPPHIYSRSSPPRNSPLHVLTPPAMLRQVALGRSFISAGTPWFRDIWQLETGGGTCSGAPRESGSAAGRIDGSRDRRRMEAPQNTLAKTTATITSVPALSWRRDSGDGQERGPTDRDIDIDIDTRPMTANERRLWRRNQIKLAAASASSQGSPPPTISYRARDMHQPDDGSCRELVHDDSSGSDYCLSGSNSEESSSSSEGEELLPSEDLEAEDTARAASSSDEEGEDGEDESSSECDGESQLADKGRRRKGARGSSFSHWETLCKNLESLDSDALRAHFKERMCKRQELFALKLGRDILRLAGEAVAGPRLGTGER